MSITKTTVRQQLVCLSHNGQTSFQTFFYDVNMRRLFIISFHRIYLPVFEETTWIFKVKLDAPVDKLMMSLEGLPMAACHPSHCSHQSLSDAILHRAFSDWWKPQIETYQKQRIPFAWFAAIKKFNLSNEIKSWMKATQSRIINSCFQSELFTSARWNCETIGRKHSE